MNEVTMDEVTMDEALLRDYLEQAERHVAQAEQHIVQQRELIATLERNCHHVAVATDFLRTLEDALATHIAGRDRIRSKLAKSWD